MFSKKDILQKIECINARPSSYTLTIDGFKPRFLKHHRRNIEYNLTESDIDNINQCTREIKLLFEKSNRHPHYCGSILLKRHIMEFRRSILQIYNTYNTFYVIPYGHMILSFLLMGYYVKPDRTTTLINATIKMKLL